MEKQRPKVGIGIMVLRDGKVLMGKRKNAHGSGEYAWPGGHMELNESFERCAKREVKEETGMEVENVRFLRLMNFIKYEKHYVGLIADWKSGEPKVLEPEKCEGWDWYSLDNLPEPLFVTVPSYLEALKTGRNYFDS